MELTLPKIEVGLDVSKIKTMVGDWVVLEKEQDLDGAKKIGDIIVPETINTNIRESKIGLIVAVGEGYRDNKNRFRPSDVEDGRYAYYTRYGKEPVQGIDDKLYIFTRNRGVLAYLDIEDGEIKKVYPRHDRLYLRQIEDGEKVLDSGIIVPERLKKYDEYLRWEVLAVGPGEPKKFDDHIDMNDRIKPATNVGDIIYASKMSGVQVSWYDKKTKDKVVRRLIPEGECAVREVLL